MLNWLQQALFGAKLAKMEFESESVRHLAGPTDSRWSSDGPWRALTWT